MINTPIQSAVAIDASMQQAVSVLEQSFEKIYHTRMRDVPIVNPKLSVASVGFRPWGEYWLGALLTPWFLNLVLLPTKENNSVKVGSKCKHALPCGDFTFIAGHEPQLGDYWSCSLMSPVLELVDQQHAEAVMQEALAVIFTAPNDDDDQWVAEKTEAERFQLSHNQQQLQVLKQQRKADAPEDSSPSCSRREFLARCVGKSSKSRKSRE